MPPFFSSLREPLLVVFHQARRSQERTIGLKEIQDLPPCDPHPQRLQSLEQLPVDLIHGPMLRETQPSYQQHDIQPIGHARPRQRIRLQAAVRPPLPFTLRIRTTVTSVDQFDHSLQRDHRAPRQCHRLSQSPLAHRALMLDGSIPASAHVWIGSASFHGLSPCLSRIPFSFSPFLFYSIGSNACFAPTVFFAL